jgi:hypothetical protein
VYPRSVVPGITSIALKRTSLCPSSSPAASQNAFAFLGELPLFFQLLYPDALVGPKQNVISVFYNGVLNKSWNGCISNINVCKHTYQKSSPWHLRLILVEQLPFTFVRNDLLIPNIFL